MVPWFLSFILFFFFVLFLQLDNWSSTQYRVEFWPIIANDLYNHKLRRSFCTNQCKLGN
jgi:hypothetical protein